MNSSNGEATSARDHRGGKVTILQREGQFAVTHEWIELHWGFNAACWTNHGSYPTLIEAAARARKVAERHSAVVEPFPPAISPLDVCRAPAEDGAALAEYDMGPASSVPDLRGKDFEDTVDAVVAWFFENYEDPVESCPYASAEGGYFYVWGGPYDAREEIDAGFGSAISQEVTDAAVERIELDGLEWTSSQSRMIEVT